MDQTCYSIVGKGQAGSYDYVSWAAFHAENQPNPVDPISVVALLPLFSEKSANMAWIFCERLQLTSIQFRLQ